MIRFLLFLLPACLPAQEVIRIRDFCAYRNETILSEYYQWAPGTEADQIVSDICRAVSLQKNFIVKASNVENAMALMDADGHRMILYSTLFLEKFKADTRTRWAAYSVLAHEIGHHLNHHRFDESDPARRRILELQADEFSGGALRLLGSAAPVDASATPDAVRASDMYKNYYSSLGETVVGNPDQSRLLNKPLVRNTLHGGGLIFESADDPAAKRIRYWINRPMPAGQDEFSSAANTMFTPADPATGACNSD